MQKLFLPFSLLLILILFGSVGFAHEETVSFQGNPASNDSDSNDDSLDDSSDDSTDDSADDTLGDDTSSDGLPNLANRGKARALRANAMKIKERLKVKVEDISDDDADVLDKLGISPERLKNFSKSDIETFFMKLKENNPNILVRLRMEKENDDKWDSIKAEKKVIREESNKKMRLNKLAKLLERIALRLDNADLVTRIKVQLERTENAEISSVIVNDIENKLTLQVNQVRAEHLKKRGAVILEKSNLLEEKLDAIISKLDAAAATVPNANAKQVVEKALTRLKGLKAKFTQQLSQTQEAYDAFIAVGGSTKENARELNSNIVKLKTIGKRARDAVEITRRIIARLREVGNEVIVSDDVIVNADGESETILTETELEVEIETEAEDVVNETTTTSADDSTDNSPAPAATGGTTA